MSVFLAVDLDATVRAEVTLLMQRYRETFPAKWLRSDKLHCTLVFLGHPSSEQVARWTSALAILARKHQPFSLSLGGAGTFVTARAPSVLWLGVTGELHALAALQADTQATLQSEVRKYLPHVTLARAQVPEHFAALRSQLADFSSSPFNVSKLTLYESLSDQYRVLFETPLGALR